MFVRLFHIFLLSDGVGCNIAKYDEDLTAVAATVELAEVHTKLHEKVSRLSDLITKCSEGMAERAQPKVTEVLQQLKIMATPMVEVLAINANESASVLQELGKECSVDGLNKELFDKQKSQLEQSVAILSRFRLYLY